MPHAFGLCCAAQNALPGVVTAYLLMQRAGQCHEQLLHERAACKIECDPKNELAFKELFKFTYVRVNLKAQEKYL